MRKTFVWLLTTTGKMLVARMAKMNISGIKQSINCMVLAIALQNLLAAALKRPVLLRVKQQLRHQAKALPQQAKPLLQNINKK